MPKNLYLHKPDAYFSRARTEIAAFLEPQKKWRALEIGCSQGHTLAWLKREGYCDWVAGVEPYAQPETSALAVIDEFFTNNIEEGLPPLAPASLDLVLCLDVLEHLIDPWQTIRSLDTLLKPGGRFIISVPNVRNYHILADLILRGRFEYSDSGILDHTHLRFFTRDSAIALARTAGAKLEGIFGTGLERPQKRLLARLGLESFLATQFVICAKKAG